MSTILCWHKWSKWSEIVSCNDRPYQFASCDKCNKIIRRGVCLTNNGVNPSLWNKKPEFSVDFHDMKTLCLQLIEAEKLNDILDAIANNIGYELTSQYVCGGANCSAENGLDHSPECVLEHELTVKGVSDES